MKQFNTKQAKMKQDSKHMTLLFKVLHYLILFVIVGLVYWCMMAIMQAGLKQVFSLSSRHSYLTAMLISWLVMTVWLFHRNDKQYKKSLSYQLYKHTQDQKLSSESTSIQQVEHTPDYQDYQPKFR